MANEQNCRVYSGISNFVKTFHFLGVLRKTQEEKDFANFDIFDDPDAPYSSFKFEYQPKTFERLHELMKFNTLLHEDLIKEKIAYYVGYRRNNRGYAKKKSFQ